jgi:hypothetical protein
MADEYLSCAIIVRGNKSMYNRNADFVINFFGCEYNDYEFETDKKKKEFFRTPSGKDPIKISQFIRSILLILMKSIVKP